GSQVDRAQQSAEQVAVLRGARVAQRGGHLGVAAAAVGVHAAAVVVGAPPSRLTPTGMRNFGFLDSAGIVVLVAGDQRQREHGRRENRRRSRDASRRARRASKSRAAARADGAPSRSISSVRSLADSTGCLGSATRTRGLAPRRSVTVLTPR